MNKPRISTLSVAALSLGMCHERKAGGGQDKHVTNTLEAV